MPAGAGRKRKKWFFWLFLKVGGQGGVAAVHNVQTYRHIQRDVLWYEAANVYAFKADSASLYGHGGGGGERGAPVEQARE